MTNIIDLNPKREAIAQVCGKCEFPGFSIVKEDGVKEYNNSPR